MEFLVHSLAAVDVAVLLFVSVVFVVGNLYLRPALPLIPINSFPTVPHLRLPRSVAVWRPELVCVTSRLLSFREIGNAGGNSAVRILEDRESKENNEMRGEGN